MRFKRPVMKCTEQEKLLKDKLAGVTRPPWFAVHSQQIIGRYICDFAIFPHCLVIEVDGSTHTGMRFSRDKARETFLRNCGFRIIRFTNEQVDEDIDSVVDQIVSACEQRIVRAHDKLHTEKPEVAAPKTKNQRLSTLVV